MPSSSIAAFQQQGGKKRINGPPPNRLCQPCVTPSSNSSLDYRRSDVRIAENGSATSSGVSKSAKVVLVDGPPLIEVLATVVLSIAWLIINYRAQLPDLGSG